MLVVFYVASCPHTDALLSRLHQTSLQLSKYFDSLQVSVQHPILAKFDIQNHDSFIKSLGVGTVPILYFFRVVNKELIAMDFVGHSNEAPQIVSIVLHYWYRFVYGPVFALQTMDEVQVFLEHNGAGMLSPVKGGLHPDYTHEEKEIIEWLMDTPNDPCSLLVQCRSSEQQNPVYQDLDDFCNLQSSRRDLACVSIADCGKGADGDVVSILLHHDDIAGLASVKKPASQTVRQFGIQQSTPTLLFFERISTAPIAFPLWRTLHAVLFVSLSKNEASKQAIMEFYNVCLKNRLTAELDDMVCLVVPETETRVLTTFGIDIWTPLDDRLTKGTNVPDLLPTVMITDKRATNQLKRYYLDAPAIVQNHNSISTFMDSFWNNTLQPECKSSKRPLRTNKHGVEMISGNTFQAAVLDRKTRHSLLYVTSPTCGHCKRFSILWNKLATLVGSVGWSEFLDIQQLDSTRNEIVQVEIDPAFVPAVYYFAPNAKNVPVYYDIVDKYGNGAGKLDDPLDIIDWFLDKAGLDEDFLLQALE